MQVVFRWRGSISEYETGFSSIQTEHPSRCGECGCTKFHKWGSYRRYVAEEDRDYEIPIRRFRCVRCRKTTSYLPSFCIRGICCSMDLVMKLLSALILKIQIELGEMRRRAYIFLKRFVRQESLWLVYLRARGFGDFPRDKRDRRIKIFTALREQYNEGDFSAKFLTETGRHFMSTK